MKKTLLAMSLAAAAASAAHADTITAWDFTGDQGNQASEPSFSAAAGVTGSAITRSAGLGANSGANAFNSNGWESTVSGTGSNEYLSFGFTVDSGYAVDLSTLLMGTKASSTGPGTLGLFYSGDGFSTQLYTFVQDNTNSLYASIDLSALPTLTGSVEFRLYEIGNTQADGVGATSSTGTLRLTDHDTEGTMAFIGSVTAVPEPETYGMLLSGLAVLAGVARRRNKA